MTMSLTEIYERLQTTNVILAFDTSVTARRGFLPFCEQVNRINVKRDAMGSRQQIGLCVPAVAHTERLFDLAQQYQNNYNIQFINEVLANHQIEIPPFTSEDARRCADLLFQRYKTPAKWYAFKKRRCLECVGLPFDRPTQGTGQTCGAPNDWLIIAQASDQNMVLVMDDVGKHREFATLANVARYDPVREAIEQILNGLL